jgi:hypothetical protein
MTSMNTNDDVDGSETENDDVDIQLSSSVKTEKSYFVSTDAPKMLAKKLTRDDGDGDDEDENDAISDHAVSDASVREEKKKQAEETCVYRAGLRQTSYVVFSIGDSFPSAYGGKAVCVRRAGLRKGVCSEKRFGCAFSDEAHG